MGWIVLISFIGTYAAIGHGAAHWPYQVAVPVAIVAGLVSWFLVEPRSRRR